VLSTVYDPALALKATLPRLVPAGDIGDTDVYGIQQHGPLLDVDIPICVVSLPPASTALTGRKPNCTPEIA
jgi:hypothetical protein